MTLLEYFKTVGYYHPKNVPKEKFLNIVELYSGIHGDVITQVDGRYLKYICPITGEIIRRVKQKNYLHQDHKLLEDMQLIDEVLEVKELNQHCETLTTYHTTRLLAELPKSHGQMLLRMIDSLLYGNNGVVFCEDRSDYQSVHKAVKYFSDNGIARQVHNGLQNTKHYSFKIAPHLAYKGNKSKQDNEIIYWITETARMNSNSVSNR